MRVWSGGDWWVGVNVCVCMRSPACQEVVKRGQKICRGQLKIKPIGEESLYPIPIYVLCCTRVCKWSVAKIFYRIIAYLSLTDYRT